MRRCHGRYSPHQKVIVEEKVDKSRWGRIFVGDRPRELVVVEVDLFNSGGTKNTGWDGPHHSGEGQIECHEFLEGCKRIGDGGRKEIVVQHEVLEVNETGQ